MSPAEQVQAWREWYRTARGEPPPWPEPASTVPHMSLTEAVEYLESRGITGVSLCQNTSALLKCALLVRGQEAEIEALRARQTGSASSRCADG